MVLAPSVVAIDRLNPHLWFECKKRGTFLTFDLSLGWVLDPIPNNSYCLDTCKQLSFLTPFTYHFPPTSFLTSFLTSSQFHFGTSHLPSFSFSPHHPHPYYSTLPSTDHIIANIILQRFHILTPFHIIYLHFSTFMIRLGKQS